MAEKLDYKKKYKDLYLPKAKPALLEVPTMRFLMVDGAGAPEVANCQQAMQVLYALSFTIKMSKMAGNQPHGSRAPENRFASAGGAYLEK